MLRLLALALLTLFLDGSAYASNTSQDTVDLKQVSVTLTGTNVWHLLAAPDGQRAAMQCQNVGVSTMGFYISPYSQGVSMPTATGIGSPGVLVMFSAGSYEPSGGFIFGGAIWVIGLTGDTMTCYLSNTQP